MTSHKFQIHEETLLGQLLTTSGIIEVEILAEIFHRRRRTDTSLGEALIKGGHLVGGDLKAALEATQMVQQGVLTSEHAAHVLRYAYQQCLPFQDAFEATLMHPERHYAASRLGELLVAAKVISQFQLSVAIGQSQDAGLTLGRILVVSGVLTYPMLRQAIDALSLVRDGKILFEHAASALYLVSAKNASLEDALARMSPGPFSFDRSAKIGELLAEAGIVHEAEALNCAEIGLEQNRPIGRVMTDCGLIKEIVLKAALQLQAMVRTATMSLVEAHELLHQVHRFHIPIDQLLLDLEAMKERVVQFLIEAEVITDYDIYVATTNFPQHANDKVWALLMNENIDSMLFRSALRCVRLSMNGKIDEETATLAIDYCRRACATVDVVLNRLAVESFHKLPALVRPAPVIANMA